MLLVLEIEKGCVKNSFDRKYLIKRHPLIKQRFITRVGDTTRMR